MIARHTVACVLAASISALAAASAAAPAAASAQPPAPVLQYNQRYVMHQFDNDTIAVLDTADGKVWTALIAQYGFKTWRAYDLNAVAKERNLPDTAPPAALAQRTVHARSTVRVFNVTTGAGDNEQ